MPVDSMPFVDVLIFGSSCKSLSAQNCDRRDLLDTDQNDPKCSSGATMASCLQYVVERLPHIVVIENVMGMLRLTRTGTRNIQVVLDKLTDAGYVCGYDKQNSASFLLPQSRRRVYIWAHRRGSGFDERVWQDSVRLSKPGARIPLEACLLEAT